MGRHRGDWSGHRVGEFVRQEVDWLHRHALPLAGREPAIVEVQGRHLCVRVAQQRLHHLGPHALGDVGAGAEAADRHSRR